MIETKKVQHNTYLNKLTKEKNIGLIQLAANMSRALKGLPANIKITDLDEEGWGLLWEKYTPDMKKHKLIP